MLASQQIQIDLDVPFPVAEAFLSEAHNYSLWASGLGAGIKAGPNPDWWIADSPAGQVMIRFSHPNKVGIFDHWVKLENGTEIYIPMRLIPNQDGCLLVFTLFRQPGMTDEQFVNDKQWVEKDLQQLKGCLQSRLSG